MITEITVVAIYVFCFAMTCIYIYREGYQNGVKDTKHTIRETEQKERKRRERDERIKEALALWEQQSKS